MAILQLIQVPRSVAELQMWQFTNQSNHRDIIAQVFSQLSVRLDEYPLQPFDPKDENDLQNFLNLHQQMHQDMDNALGLDSFNLSEVSWDDPASLNQWLFIHYVEHQAAGQKLGIP